MMDKKKNLKNGKKMLDFDNTNPKDSNKYQSEELNLYDVLKGNKELKLSSEEIKKREAQLKTYHLRKEKRRSESGLILSFRSKYKPDTNCS